MQDGRNVTRKCYLRPTIDLELFASCDVLLAGVQLASTPCFCASYLCILVHQSSATPIAVYRRPCDVGVPLSCDTRSAGKQVETGF